MSDSEQEYFGLRVQKMTLPELLEEAEAWADGLGEDGMKGNERSMDIANLITMLITHLERAGKVNV